MLKHIIHLVFFVAGAGAGVWWGVDHPTQASQVAAQEQAKVQQAWAVAQGKKEVLQQVVSEQSADPNAAPGKLTAAEAHLSKYQQMLQVANQEMNNVKGTVHNP